MSMWKNIVVLQSNPSNELSNANKESITYLAAGILDDILTKKFNDYTIEPPVYWFVTDTSLFQPDNILNKEIVGNFLKDILKSFVAEYLINECLYTKDHAYLLIEKALNNIHFEQELEGLCQEHALVDKFLCIISIIYGRSEVRIFTGKENFAHMKRMFSENWKRFNHPKFLSPEKIEFVSSTKYFDLRWRSKLEEYIDNFKQLIFR